jgi:hypothetical protein
MMGDVRLVAAIKHLPANRAHNDVLDRALRINTFAKLSHSGRRLSAVHPGDTSGRDLDGASCRRRTFSFIGSGTFTGSLS